MSASLFRRLPACFLLLLAAFSLPAPAHGQFEVWLAPRTDGVPGTGAPGDPFDASDQKKFDTLLSGYYVAGKANITFHLAPGIYRTYGECGGWKCLSNWKFHGAGRDSTVIQMAAYTYSGTNGYGGNTVFAGAEAFETGLEVTDLTIDCCWLNMGSTLAGAFTAPQPGQTASVAVLSSTWARVGKYAYLQRMDTHQVVGFYLVKSIKNRKRLILENLQGSDPRGKSNLPPGTRISGQVFVGPAVNTCGIDFGAKDCRVERVRVTDSGTPIYEGPLGIILGQGNRQPTGDPFYLADGNVIRDCLIDNLWGTSGWCIAIVSNNPNMGPASTYISAVVEDNVIHSNGMHQGLSSWGTANALWANNTVTDCDVGWFVDVGFNKDARILNNLFVNNNDGIQLGGGYFNGWMRFEVTGNHIMVPQGKMGMLLNGQVHDSVFSGNQILAMDGALVGTGIQVNPYHTDSNIFSNNVVSAALSNVIPASVGSQFNNTTPAGAPITMRNR